MRIRIEETLEGKLRIIHPKRSKYPKTLAGILKLYRLKDAEAVCRRIDALTKIQEDYFDLLERI